MTRTRAVLAGSAVVLLVSVGGIFALREVVLRGAERNLMVLHENGPQRPDGFGAASEVVQVQSGRRSLQASIVHAPATCGDRVAVLLFHGRGETISDWARTQAFLGRQCISTMVFDYSGHGSSTPPASIHNLNADALAAYADFVRRFTGSGRRCVIGHSMGVAPMLEIYPSMRPAPDCTVAANGFSSLEEVARAGGAPGPAAALLHWTWNNLRAVKAVHGPLLLVHSDSDQVVTPGMVQRLEVAAPITARRVTAHGFGHNAIYEAPGLGWWVPVLTFLRDPLGS